LYIIIHVIYNSEYFSSYTTVYHFLPQARSPHCVKRLAEVNETTQKGFSQKLGKNISKTEEKINDV